MTTSVSGNPKKHTANIKEEFTKLSEHLREDVEKVDDPKQSSF